MTHYSDAERGPPGTYPEDKPQERSVPERPPHESVAHMSDTVEGKHVDLERRVCPNCRLYFDTGADSGQVFCGTACMLNYGDGLRADGGDPSATPSTEVDR